ncbi:MAG: lysophospholipid acyltransferase family protein [Halothiobacillaceae bacterium]|nr:lysophospholipid acyltransferase family protein [Halothiobacillaceae bacterium]
MRHWHAQACRALAVDITTQGEAQPGVLYICNHISWLDIPVLGSQLPGVRFLAKSEIRSWPLIGWLAARAGSLFIERGNGHDSVQHISHALQQGHSVLIFPEGTTTDGLSLRRFHPRLLQAAHEANAAIQPIALRYLDAQQMPNPRVAYIDDDRFNDTLQRIVHENGLRAEVHFLALIHPEATPRSQLAALAHARISEALPHVLPSSPPAHPSDKPLACDKVARNHSSVT